MWCQMQHMSLGQVLGTTMAQCKRARVPSHLLQQCKPADQTVVENILTVLQDFVPHVNISACVLTVTASAYAVVVPCTVNEVTLRQLAAVQDYSPARISQLQIAVKDGSMCLVLCINNENSLVAYSEVAVMRICKRTRYI